MLALALMNFFSAERLMPDAAGFAHPGFLRRTWELATFLLLSFSAIATPVSGYNSRLWQTDDGLPQNAIQAIVQTRDGYLWVGTQDGLARFDGVHFTLFNSKNIPEIRGNVITALCETDDGSLWIGTDSGGLTRLKNGKFSHYGKTDGLLSDIVRAIAKSDDGGLWIGTGAGLVQYKGEKLEKSINSLNATVRAICEDKGGALWIATGLGLSVFHNGQLKVFQKNNGLLHNSVRAVCLDHDGDVWIGTDGGLSRMKNDQFSHFTKSESREDIFFNVIYEDHARNLWVGTAGGLSRLINGVLTPELTSTGAPFDPVFSIYEDREENIWVGTKSGLYRLTPRRFACYSTEQGLTHNETVSVFEDKKGKMWIGTRGGGLNQLTEDGSFSFSTTSFTTTNGLSSDLVLALHESRDGAFWIGTDFVGGLNRWKDGKFNYYQRQSGFNSAVIAVLEDKHENLWVGTRNGLLQMRKGELGRFNKVDVKNLTIRTIFEDSAGKLWVGTDGGLSVLDGTEVKTFTTADGLPAAPVFSIHEDAENVLWISTRGAGISRFDQKQFRNYTTAHGLPHDSIFEILEDDNRWLWMSCPKGIFRVAKSDFDKLAAKQLKALNCICYGKEDGMITSECIGIAKPAGLKASNGKLWFTTAKGVVCVDPEMKLNENVPPLTIEHILVDGQKLSIESEARAQPGRGELEVHYAALSFHAPEKNRFKYKLDGIDADWIDAGTRRVAYYNNLPPGNYRFHVIGCNNDGVWNMRGASLGVVMLPHFWQTLWFKSSTVLCCGALGFVFYRARQNRRREIEQLRVRIAADLHDEIGANLASIALLSQLDPKPQSENSDLTEIHRIALNTAQTVREIVWFINPDYDTLPQMVSRMKDVAANLLAGIEHHFNAPLENNNTKPSLEFRRNMFLIYKEILHNIAKHSQATCVQIAISEERGRFCLKISDNGVGFDEGSTRNGNGLKNIRLRVARINGEVEFKSHAGQGTNISIYARLT